MQITSTLWGMEQYYNYKDKSLFQDIRLPDGVNKQTLVNTILVEAGELEIIYPNGDFLKVAIDTWFDRKYPMLERWIKAINTDYKPLENYNRTEQWTLKANGTTSNEGTKSSTTTNTGSRNSTASSTDTDKGTDTTSDTSSTTTTDSTTVGNQTTSDETQVSAFNTSAYSPSEKVSSTVGGRTDSSSGTDETTTSGTLTKSNTRTSAGTVEDTTANTGSIAEESQDTGSSTNESEHEGKTFGNIGVTTSQQMLKEEMTLWATIDIYKETAEMFVQEFCIPIY